MCACVRVCVCVCVCVCARAYVRVCVCVPARVRASVRVSPFVCMQAANVILMSAMYDEHETVRYESLNEYQRHPKSRVLPKAADR